ncbi:MAG: TonB-dependent receptor [candidate division Zixibacteria bacterium]|nr:TonB-dependent receptor [candidate division Zixibacteria bacterium]
MRRFFWAILVFLTAVPCLYAQTNTRIKGYVFDSENGAPVGGARIDIKTTAYITQSDDWGNFSFHDIPPGNYTVLVSAPGYEEKELVDIEIVSDVTRRLMIELTRINYQIEGIIVKGRRVSFAGDRIAVIRKEEITNSRAGNLSELLETVNGLYIQKTGSSAGSAEVKIRGSASNQVLVLIDGHRVNPSGSGVTDLNAIPLETVEQVEIHKGGASAEFGPDALAGVINIITRPSHILPGISLEGEKIWGKWKTQINNLNLSNLFNHRKVTGKFAFSNKKSNGDFEFDYHQPDTVISGIRVNNDNTATSYFASGMYQPSGKAKLGFSGQWYHAENGLPGRPTSQNRSARLADDRTLITGGLDYTFSGHFSLQLNLGYSRFTQHFTDRLSRSGNYDSKYTNDIFNLGLKQHFLFGSGSLVRLGTEFRRDILYHDDYWTPSLSMGKTVRDNGGLFIAAEQKLNIADIKIFKEMVLKAALRYDNVRTYKDSTSWQDTTTSHHIYTWSPKISLAMGGERKSFDYVVRASAGRSLRLPSINSLFWKGDARSGGNPGLLPEKARHYEIGGEISGTFAPVSFSSGLTFFNSDVTDLIVWVQGYGGVWRPENLESADLDGHEEFLEISLFNKGISFIYQNTVTEAVNKTPGPNDYNKQLVFSPHYITSLTTRLDMKGLFAAYSVRLVDKTYILKANTKYYDSYRLDDIRLGVTKNINGHWKLGMDLKIYNISDADYVLLTHYPMPGREWHFGFKVAYGN